MGLSSKPPSSGPRAGAQLTTLQAIRVLASESRLGGAVATELAGGPVMLDAARAAAPLGRTVIGRVPVLLTGPGRRSVTLARAGQQDSDSGQ